MVVEFGEKSLLGKAQSRPDLVRQLIDKARREVCSPPSRLPSIASTSRWRSVIPPLVRW